MTTQPDLEQRVSASLKRLYPHDTARWAFTPATPAHGHRRTLLVAASVAVVLAVVAAVVLVRLPSDRSDASLGRSFPLASNGWTPDQPMLLAGIAGHFHAAPGNRPGVICAWIGSANQPRPTLWPKGWRVRLHPTQLIDPAGTVFANAGDPIRSAGGIISDKSQVPGCGPANSPTNSLADIQHGR